MAISFKTVEIRLVGVREIVTAEIIPAIIKEPSIKRSARTFLEPVRIGTIVKKRSIFPLFLQNLKPLFHKTIGRTDYRVHADMITWRGLIAMQGNDKLRFDAVD
jgi:hypothetical protein